MKKLAALKKAGLNFYFFLLILVVVAAWVYPAGGSDKSVVPWGKITDYGVAIIFFFYGLKLNRAKLSAGLGHWKLHAIIQLTTFLVFPIVALIFYKIFYRTEYEYWWLGIFYLAALPSTVSSSVVMVSIAGGNISAAIFNASVSSLIGIFITPLWMSLFIESSSISTSDLSTVIISLCVQVLLPVVLGLALNKRLGWITEKYNIYLKNFDQAIILIIVYRAFCRSFEEKMFDGYQLTEILILSAGMLLLFLLMVMIMNSISHLFKFPYEDRMTIVFCGSKKSLVQGAVMGQVLFTDASLLGIILLPLMIYHALQLLAGSIIAQRNSQRIVA